jgi:tetratricopeptide (TPR) repeat protein
VKFRDGVRLGNALKVNCDRLNYFAKKELAKGKLEEAEELYEMAIEMSPRDGRAYLGLSRIAQRRRDFKYAKECLKSGIANSLSDKTWGANGMKVTDTGANPFLLQALGTLEERMGHLSEAERLYIAAARSRPSHAAAWVALAQLRCRKLRQGPDAGRICYRTAEVELMRAGLKPSSHVYTAWASLEWKAGQIKRARELFRQALDIDPKCSAAWNQLGVMEAQVEHWDEAEQCFQSALKFDGRNSRVLQAYAIMETKRPDSDSRKALGLFERALKANPRDGGVYQAYALFVAKLGDIDAARGL